MDVTRKYVTSNPDRTPLNKDLYSHYYWLIDTILDNFIDQLQHKIIKENVWEQQVIIRFTQKLKNTFHILRVKYAFEEELALQIDTTDSCFPSSVEIAKLEQDIFTRNEKLQKYPSEKLIKEEILTALFKEKKKPQSLIRTLKQQQFYSHLNEIEYFLNFNKGEIQQINTNKDNRGRKQYKCSWASYSAISNCPYVYMMIFETSFGKKESLEESHFWQKIKPMSDSLSLSAYAGDIDAYFKNVHPKLLKRVCLGPIFSYYAQDNQTYTDIIKQLTIDDFALVFETEVTTSIDEKSSKSFFGSGEVMQIFHIDRTDRECLERHASQIHKYLMAPHKVIQHLTRSNAELLKNLTKPPLIINALK